MKLREVFLLCLLAALAATLKADNVTLMGTGPGPWAITINGVATEAMPVSFANPTAIGQSWAATLSSIGGFMTSTENPNQPLWYEQEAYLLTLLIQPNADSTDILDAARAIVSAEPQQLSDAAQNYLIGAELYFSALDANNFEVVTPTGFGPGPFTAAPAPVQELIVELAPNAPVPEPAPVELIGSGLLIAAGLVRRRGGRN